MRIIPVAAAAALALALAGCAGSPDPAPQPAPNTTTAPPPAASGELPCGVVTAQEFAEIFGEDLGDGEANTSSTVTEQDVTWHPATCEWEGDDLEVELGFADAAAFDTGAITCSAPLGIGQDVQPVGGIGDQAWWVSDDSHDDEGTLRACTATHLIDVEVDGDGIDARTAAITLMERALAAVG